jgi:hypothetical protein
VLKNRLNLISLQINNLYLVVSRRRNQLIPIVRELSVHNFLMMNASYIVQTFLSTYRPKSNVACLVTCRHNRLRLATCQTVSGGSAAHCLHDFASLSVPDAHSAISTCRDEILTPNKTNAVNCVRMTLQLFLLLEVHTTLP